MSQAKNHYIQSPNYTKYMEKLGWETLKIDKKYYGYLKKIPFFKKTILKIPRTPFDINYQNLDKLAQQHKAIFVKIEPNEIIENTEKEIKNSCLSQNLKDQEFISDDFPICQTKTIFVDLTLSEEKLLKSLRSETRHHLRKSWKQNLKVEITESNNSPQSKESFEKFYDLFELCAKERGFYSPFKTQMHNLWQSFRHKAIIILTYENSKLLSGALILIHDKTAYYKYGASISYGRKKYASYYLFWEMFLWTKKKGLKVFDLEGIFDSRYHRTKKYKGFTQFKRGWSKNEITYIGSFTKYYWWPLKLLSKIGITV